MPRFASRCGGTNVSARVAAPNSSVSFIALCSFRKREGIAIGADANRGEEGLVILRSRRSDGGEYGDCGVNGVISPLESTLCSNSVALLLRETLVGAGAAQKRKKIGPNPNAAAYSWE